MLRALSRKSRMQGGGGKEREIATSSVSELPDIKPDNDPVVNAIQFYAGDRTPLDRVREQLTRQFSDRDAVEINSMIKRVQERRESKTKGNSS
ncbi:hypothetical protein A2696_01865 [Candidatus Curtissbacteria bacterium RIFCSPHIGHO2_01_FULL_41_13]|uniref:Uncharacterized protein n=1 Tax=Candidatus Curtissbacteria bacterium RIFCSPHIGHO2_01_FULL_41_13 TaxID=1797745 RepID=A0A1F5FY32_9BACT|nr:MAG: hypothetical protein A2696_01865 [Candidatus Curtissbacteria bacterium RIFCSPHIGHO2_01_FULL_41_13]